MSHDQPEWDFVLYVGRRIYFVSERSCGRKKVAFGYGGREGEKKEREKKNAHTKKFEKERNRGKNIKSVKKTKPDLTRNIFRAIWIDYHVSRRFKFVSLYIYRELFVSLFFFFSFIKLIDAFALFFFFFIIDKVFFYIF